MCCNSSCPFLIIRCTSSTSSHFTVCLCRCCVKRAAWLELVHVFLNVLSLWERDFSSGGHTSLSRLWKRTVPLRARRKCFCLAADSFGYKKCFHVIWGEMGHKRSLGTEKYSEAFAELCAEVCVCVCTSGMSASWSESPANDSITSADEEREITELHSLTPSLYFY